MGGTGDNTSNNPSHSSHQPEPRYSRRKELLILAAALVISSVLFAGIYAIWRYERRHPSTEDALLHAHYVWIRPQVTGQVFKLFVTPNAFVQAGDPLFQIDPRLYREHLAKAEKELVLVRHEIDSDKAAVAAAQARVKEQEAAVATARQYAERYRQMVKKGAASELSTIGYENDLDLAQEKLLEIKAKLQQAIVDLGDENVQKARVEKAEIQVRLAQLDLEWTRVTAPTDGQVTAFELRTGDVVQPGDKLFPFIETGDWWVQANFKETQLAGIRPGMPATVTIDIYGDRRFKGVVESISGSAAAAFSLLPAQNTTGNWVKVTQRIPVRIHMLTRDHEHPYRLGASTEVTVEREAPLIEEYAHPDKTPPAPS
jgi:membrane fusion protein (multidrug efflux system)